MRLTAQQVYGYARDAGFQPSEAREMTALARRESGYDTNAIRVVRVANSMQGPEASYGLWQINMEGALGPYRRAQLGLSADTELFDPAVNARAARWLYVLNGGHAHDWYTDRYGSAFGYAEKYNQFLSALPSEIEMEALYSSSGGSAGLQADSGVLLIVLFVAGLVYWGIR